MKKSVLISLIALGVSLVGLLIALAAWLHKKKELDCDDFDDDLLMDAIRISISPRSISNTPTAPLPHRRTAFLTASRNSFALKSRRLAGFFPPAPTLLKKIKKRLAFFSEMWYYSRALEIQYRGMEQFGSSSGS